MPSASLAPEQSTNSRDAFADQAGDVQSRVGNATSRRRAEGATSDPHTSNRPPSFISVAASQRPSPETLSVPSNPQVVSSPRLRSRVAEDGQAALVAELAPRQVHQRAVSREVEEGLEGSTRPRARPRPRPRAPRRDALSRRRTAPPAGNRDERRRGARSTGRRECAPSSTRTLTRPVPGSTRTGSVRKPPCHVLLWPRARPSASPTLKREGAVAFRLQCDGGLHGPPVRGDAHVTRRRRRCRHQQIPVRQPGEARVGPLRVPVGHGDGGVPPRVDTLRIRRRLD